ncbi:8379_t:CDS:2, partial [Funneliformis caledonium]
DQGHLSYARKRYDLFHECDDPLNASNIVPPDPQFIIVDSQGNNLNTVVLNRITCFVIFKTRGYTMSLGEQVIFMLKTQIQQCTIVDSNLNYFTIP